MQAKLVTALFTNTSTSFAPGILRAFACATPGLSPVTVTSSVGGSEGARGGFTTAGVEGDDGREVMAAALDSDSTTAGDISYSSDDDSMADAYPVKGSMRGQDSIDLAAAAGPIVPVREKGCNGICCT
jgi:hypothetical protein